MKQTVKNETRCSDTLLEIAGRKFLGVPTERCSLHPGQEVVVLDGPIEVKNSLGNLITIVKTKHLSETGQVHEGWSEMKDFSEATPNHPNKES